MLRAFVLSIMAAFTEVAPVSSLAATVMKIRFVTINDGQHKSAKWIAKEVNKRTGGSISV